MNIQPGRMTQNRRTSSARRDPDFGRQLVRVMKVLLFLVLVSGVLVFHIYMNQRIAETENRIRGVKQNISRVRIEITNLRNRREEYCSPEVIRRQMARFGLNLVPAEPGQVRRMAVIPSCFIRAKRSVSCPSALRNLYPSASISVHQLTSAPRANGVVCATLFSVATINNTTIVQFLTSWLLLFMVLFRAVIIFLIVFVANLQESY